MNKNNKKEKKKREREKNDRGEDNEKLSTTDGEKNGLGEV